MNTFKRFIKDESGATAIEYGLLAALISVALIVGAGKAGPAIKNIFDTVGTQLETANTVAGTNAG